MLVKINLSFLISFASFLSFQFFISQNNTEFNVYMFHIEGIKYKTAEFNTVLETINTINDSEIHSYCESQEVFLVRYKGDEKKFSENFILKMIEKFPERTIRIKYGEYQSILNTCNIITFKKNYE